MRTNVRAAGVDTPRRPIRKTRETEHDRAEERSRMPSSLRLEAVSEAADVAARVALGHFRGALAVDTKADGSPVTIADRAAETAAREWLERRFPGDGVLGEEHGASRPGGRRTWIVDPIDGTLSFVRGVPLWATLVALVEDGEAVAGALAFPALGESLVAARGEGCFWNGARTRVSDVARLADAAVTITDPRTFERAPDGAARARAWEALAREARLARTWGDAYGYLLVATGRAEAMADALAREWDLAAPSVAIAESGGVFSDWEGRPGFAGGSGLATNAALAREVRARLGVPSTGGAGA